LNPRRPRIAARAVDIHRSWIRLARRGYDGVRFCRDLRVGGGSTAVPAIG
jgi:hypothetical protein